jgi:hypothetical protein
MGVNRVHYDPVRAGATTGKRALHAVFTEKAIFTTRLFSGSGNDRHHAHDPHFVREDEDRREHAEGTPAGEGRHYGRSPTLTQPSSANPLADNQNEGRVRRDDPFRDAETGSFHYRDEGMTEDEDEIEFEDSASMNTVPPRRSGFNYRPPSPDWVRKQAESGDE